MLGVVVHRTREQIESPADLRTVLSALATDCRTQDLPEIDRTPHMEITAENLRIRQALILSEFPTEELEEIRNNGSTKHSKMLVAEIVRRML